MEGIVGPLGSRPWAYEWSAPLLIEDVLDEAAERAARLLGVPVGDPDALVDIGRRRRYVSGRWAAIGIGIHYGSFLLCS